MEGILPEYRANEPTWFYLSLPLILAVFFRFTRVWSLRNLDLVLLLCLAPGLLLVEWRPVFGYSWLFVLSSMLLLRLFGDSLLTRRPRLEANLNAQGLTFLGLSAFVFLSAVIVTDIPSQSTTDGNRDGPKTVSGTVKAPPPDKPEAGPASAIVDTAAVQVAKGLTPGDASSQSKTDRARLIETVATRILAFTAHLAVLSALIFVGYRHFGDVKIGLAMATLYLLLPCTAYDVSKANHVLPAALIAWALAFYSRPMVAGSLMGLACGMLVFPLFLLPLWAVFYGRRGAVRFTTALCLVGAGLLAIVALTSDSSHSFARQTFGSINWAVLMPTFQEGDAAGFWSSHQSVYRMPVYVAFLVMLVMLTFWPRKKNLEHLLAHSTAIVVGLQFWYPQQGGVYLLWYLPLLLMVVFRPRLSHLQPPDLDRAGERTGEQQASRPRHREPSRSGVPVGSRLFR